MARRYEYITDKRGNRRFVRRYETAPRAVAADVDPATLTKADLVTYAAGKGVDTEGTKAEILARLSDG